MALSRVWLIPFCAFAFSIAAFFVSYLIAVYKNHVTAIWPYISDSGAMPPESCIFGQLLNLSALFFTVYLRHRQIVEFYWHRLKQEGRWRTFSCAFLWVGYASAFGVSMVANFQENHVIYIHYIGALLAFGCGLLYTWAQTAFSYRMNPKLAEPVVSHCRLFLSCCSSFFFMSMVTFGPILGHQPEHEVPNGTCNHLYAWTTQEPNYREHVIGTVSEWLLAICFQLYILSFVIELRHAYCHAPKLKLVAFYDEDSEIGMAITAAVMEVQRLSRKRSIKVSTVLNSSSSESRFEKAAFDEETDVECRRMKNGRKDVSSTIENDSALGGSLDGGSRASTTGAISPVSSNFGFHPAKVANQGPALERSSLPSVPEAVDSRRSTANYSDGEPEPMNDEYAVVRVANLERNGMNERRRRHNTNDSGARKLDVCLQLDCSTAIGSPTPLHQSSWPDLRHAVTPPSTSTLDAKAAEERLRNRQRAGTITTIPSRLTHDTRGNNDNGSAMNDSGIFGDASWIVAEN